LPQPKPASGNTGQDNQGCQAAFAIGFFVLLIFALSQCDNKPAATIDAEKPFGVASLSNQVEAIEPPARIEPLAPVQVNRGLRHLRIAITAEGLPGAMIYSQSCYDGVTLAFSWAALDRCGGFDLQAVKLAQQSSEIDLSNEIEYFGPETAAARYLALAVKAGESAESADLRLEALQQQIVSEPLPSTVSPTETEAADSDLQEGESSEAASPSPTPASSSQLIDRDWLDRIYDNATGDR
jgi:hypothetical protein